MKDLIYKVWAVFGIDVNIPCGPGTGSNCPTTGADAVANILGWVYAAIGAVAVIIIIVAGIQYITSAGEPEKTKKAQSTITYTVVGLLIALSAATIIGFVTGAFG